MKCIAGNTAMLHRIFFEFGVKAHEWGFKMFKVYGSRFKVCEAGNQQRSGAYELWEPQHETLNMKP